MNKHKQIKVIFVRHVQTDQNLAMMAGNEVQVGDDPLNETGIKQAQETRDKLQEYHFDAIVSSPMIRAKKTAEIINEKHHLPIDFDDELCERSVGNLPDGVWHEMFDMDKNLDPGNEGGEDVRSFFGRVYIAIDHLIEKYDGKTVLVVAHGGVHHAFYAYANNLPWEGNMRISRIGNAGVREYVLTKHGEVSR